MSAVFLTAILVLPLAAGFILTSSTSCTDRCNQKYDKSQVCACNTECAQHHDCCQDYQQTCHHIAHSNASASCSGRCNQNYDKSQVCACNTQCTQHHDCCQDYETLCHPVVHSNPTGSSSGVVSLDGIADILWAKDVNRFSTADLTYAVQGHAVDGSTVDKAPGPLFTHVNENLFQTKQTYHALIALFDNYNPAKGDNDPLTSSDQTEIDAFLAAILATDVMKAALKFLQDHGTFTGDEIAFKATLLDIWFQPYARSGSGNHDSSGFEHVFVGEYKNAHEVNGFHNWVRMYLEEKAGHLNYLGYRKQEAPNMLEFTMTWMGRNKPINSFFLGTSPEFDLAILTLCFLTNPNHPCQYSVQGTSFKVQNYNVPQGQGHHVATAYTDYST